MVSVGVSKLGYQFDIRWSGVKVNGTHYHDVLLSQQLLPAIRQVSGVLNLWVLNHSARQCLNGQRETPAFISPDLWSPNNPDYSPVDYQICGISESRQKYTGCERFEAASDWCLDWYSTKHYLQCHWVAQASLYLHSGHRRTLGILTVTH